MGRNLFASFIIHAFIGAVIWLAAGTAMDVIVRIRVPDQTVSDGVFLLFSLVGLVLYYLLGKRFLRKQGTAVRNLLSVSGVSILGSFMWAACYFFTDGGFAWLPYMLYNAALYPLMTMLPMVDEAVFVIIAILPSLLFWGALQGGDR